MSERMIVCSQCGSVNRLPAERSASSAKCGKCGGMLFKARPQDVDGAILRRHMERTTFPVLVDVWTPWCGPCQIMTPAYEAAARELEPDVVLLKLNSDVEQSASTELGIRSIPTMVLFCGGRELGRVSGAMSAGRIIRWVRERLPTAAA
ncbi:thiol reductase thioredoxin [Pseudaminobacter arsenicus]|uniref:Thiol reductase thioredoxin n=2 Tax=Borborobacter arsenicus TaxID=1851146 RepID=A0A432V1B4_9HYPH|nr:thioredoxin domain-containing protein [Pseudaminobacter arsenicus]RUM95983.1 thiol reductase thioredoxin [Pseudaminobacter arsenicus]